MHRTFGRFAPGSLIMAILALTCLAFAGEVVGASPSWAASGWFRVPHDEAIFGGGDAMMFGVESSSSGFVAVGYDGTLDAAAVWWSTDGTTWQRSPYDTSFAKAEMDDVAEGPQGTIAVGHADNGYDLDSAVWIGAGNTWSGVPEDPAVFGGSGDQYMKAIAAGGPGWVAVGSAEYGDAAVWTSVDGMNWMRVPHDEAVFGGAQSQVMAGVTAGGPGVVAVGSDRGLDAAAVWTSVDGVNWARVPHDEAVFGGPALQSMEAVTAGGPGLVAVGSDSSGADSDAAVWTSVNGLTWTRVPHDETVFGGSEDQVMKDVTAGGPGLIAVGFDQKGADQDAAVWTSVDGLTWERTPHNEAVFGGSGGEAMRAVAVDDSGLVVAVGLQSTANDTDAAVWVNNEWPPLPERVDPTRIPVPTDGPVLIDDPSWFALRYVAVGIVVLALVVGLLGWRVLAGRGSSRTR